VWLKRNDFPPFSLLVNARDDSEIDWISLSGNIRFSQLSNSIDDRMDFEHRDMVVAFVAYIVRSADFETICSWLSTSDNCRLAAIEVRAARYVFLREYPWAQSYKSTDTSYYGHKGWSRVLGAPRSILCASTIYDNEDSDFDRSMERNIRMQLPAKWIYDKMGLKHGVLDGEFVDSRGKVIVKDPSTSQKGPSALLIRQDALSELLQKNKCKLLWAVIAEKMIVSPRLEYRNERTLEMFAGFFTPDSEWHVTGKHMHLPH
jgi:hypothetical protein